RREARAHRTDQDGRARARDFRRDRELHQPGLRVDAAGREADSRHHEDAQHDGRAGQAGRDARRPADQAVRHHRAGRLARALPVRRRRGADHRRQHVDRRRLDRPVKIPHQLDPRPMLRRATARARVALGGKKKINLALQGGGAHGAFTWGVLDQILDDGRLAIEGISGASAGAVNAVMLADGLARGGPDEAKARLAAFWRAASLGRDLPPLQRALVERLFSFLPLEGSPVAAWFDALARYLSPYDLNPLNINPLRELIERFVDFEAVRDCSQLALFISATNVHTGRLRIFPREKVTTDVIMASACLPFLFRAVEIDGEPYW